MRRRRRVDAVPVNHAGDFNAAIGGQIGDQRPAASGFVHHVAVNAKGHVLFARFDNPTGVLPTALPVHRLFAVDHAPAVFVGVFAPGRPVVRVEARAAVVAGTGVLFQQVLTLAVVGQVFAEVAAGLGDERAEVQHHVFAHNVAVMFGTS